MTNERDRWETLLAESLEGDLDAEKAAEFSRLLEADAERRATFVELYRQGRVLASHLRPANPTFARRILETIEGDRRPFVASVMTDVQRRWRLRRWATLTLATAGAAAIVVAALGLRPGERELARIVTAEPGVLVRHQAGQVHARPGLLLHPGDALIAGARASATIAFVGEATRFEVEPFTELKVDRGPQGTTIDLRRGEIEATVAPQPAGKPMVLSTAHAKAEVLGTRLRLSTVAGATRLEVLEGRVRFSSVVDGKALELTARHFTVADSEGLLPAVPVQVQATGAGAVTGFSLIAADAPRAPLPGYEELRDGAVIDLASLPTRRINLLARTEPGVVGSLRFAVDDDENFNTEITAPYTIVTGKGRAKDRSWLPRLGRHTITAIPYSGTYGNGERGVSVSLTLTFVNRQ